MENYFLISDAAKRVQVESHVLRYWEEELKLPIKRNEAGHRYYTNHDIERFLQIKSMKERGLQLKAIKMILKDGKLNVLPMESAGSELGEIELVQPRTEGAERQEGMAIEIVPNRENNVMSEAAREEKAQRLQWLLKQLIKETLEENNRELCKDIKESVVKELDYQFRCQEERESEREKQRELRNEAYYQRMDELLRQKSGRLQREKIKKEKPVRVKMLKENNKSEKAGKAAEVKEQLMKEIKARETEDATREKVLPLKKKRHLFT